MGKANYYGTIVVQNKVLCMQENVVIKQLTLYDQETLINMVHYYKVLCLDKQSGFVARERVNQWCKNPSKNAIPFLQRTLHFFLYKPNSVPGFE